MRAGIGGVAFFLSLLSWSDADAASNFFIKVVAAPISKSQVQFTVITNAPTPIDVAAGVNLAGQSDDDVAIGYDKFLTLTASTTVFVMDTALADRPLPRGRYNATVTFYPNWGARKNPAARNVPSLSGTQIVSLGGARSAASVERQNTLQRWVMENVGANDAWIERRYSARLGRFKKSPSSLAPYMEAYYFSEANMTFIINHRLKTIVTWRMGQADH